MSDSTTEISSDSVPDLSSDPPEVFFAKLERLNLEFANSFSGQPVADYYGLVDASPPAGSGRRDETWDLVFTFAGWKPTDGKVRRETLRVEMQVTKAELSRWMTELTPYTLLHIRGYVGSHPHFGIKAIASEIVSTKHQDSDLETLAKELQEPVTFDEPGLGTFTLDRRFNWFVAEPLWQGHKVSLSLKVGESLETKSFLDKTKELWRNQDSWAQKVNEAMMTKFLDLWRSGWGSEEDQHLTHQDLKERVTLQSIGVAAEGEFDFWFDDDLLLGGHAIRVSGSLADGVRGAQLEG